MLTKKWPRYSTCTMNTIQEPLDSPGKTRQDLLIRNYIWTSVWVTVCAVMRGKSRSRIGLLIFSLLTFCSRIILCAGCCPEHCRCLAASLIPINQTLVVASPKLWLVSVQAKMFPGIANCLLAEAEKQNHSAENHGHILMLLYNSVQLIAQYWKLRHETIHHAAKLHPGNALSSSAF